MNQYLSCLLNITLDKYKIFMKKLAIVICYLGKLPWYFDYFLHSCKYNATVHFYIISDDKSYRKSIPDNVFIMYRTMEDINAIATEKLGFEINIQSGYKLCDFKPAYGLLFSDILKEYDFWGHGDIDVIYGNIRSFITDDVLNEFDVIAVRHDFLTGYFLLFRNNEKMKMLFTKSKDYKKVFSSEKHYCFDETNFNFNGFENGNHYSQIPSEVESMTHVVKKLDESKYLKAYFDFHVIEGTYGNLYWNKGKLLYKGQYEVILYHMIGFKTIYFPKRMPLIIPDTFRISKTRIYK